MKAYSKKEPKFTKAQLIFVVDVMITSAIDAIDASLPYKRDIPKNIFDGMVNGIKEKLGFDLSIFYAQITGDGIGCCDVMEMTKMDCYLDVEKKKKVNTNKMQTRLVKGWFRNILKKEESPWVYILILENFLEQTVRPLQ